MTRPATLAEAARLIASRSLSATELTEATFARIAATEPKIHAFSLRLEERALGVAAERDAETARGISRGPLHGIPIGLKDLIDVAGVPTSASSRQRQGHLATTTATVARRLEEAGAVIVGKLHTHEFAFGVTTPTTRNAWNQDFTPAGSSGGSGTAVAAGSVYLGVGTDTGGSIRVPAAVNGVVGPKPTIGRVSRHGVFPLSWSHDHVGPLTRTVEDAALTLSAMAGHDPSDPASLRAPVPDYLAALTGDVRGLRVGVPRNFFFDRIDSQAANLVHAAIANLGRLGAELVDVTVPMAEFYGAIEGTISLSEGARVHARMLRDTPELYGDDVRQILQLGSLIPAGAYLKAQQARRLVIAAWREIFERIDLLAAPVLSGFAARVGQSSIAWPDGVEEPLFDATVRLCLPASLVGLPAISVPCGFGAAGLPTGLQLIGRPLAEEIVLRAAHAYEATTGFYPRWPVL